MSVLPRFNAHWAPVWCWCWCWVAVVWFKVTYASPRSVTPPAVQPVRSIPAHVEDIEAVVAVGPATLFTGAKDNLLKMWDMTSGTHLQTWDRLTDVYALAREGTYRRLLGEVGNVTRGSVAVSPLSLTPSPDAPPATHPSFPSLKGISCLFQAEWMGMTLVSRCWR